MIRAALDDLFSKRVLDEHPDEWGIVEHCGQPTSLGYSTTITPRTIYEAVDRRVDVIATHHDAWKFMLEQRDAVHGLLQDKGLTHIWAHLPLDLADFGTSSTLLAKIGCRHVYKPSAGEARIGTLPAPTSFQAVCATLNSLLQEQPRSMYDANRTVQRIGCVTGAGIYTSYIRDAMAHDIDLYLTGETNVYLLEYARHHELNVAVYSHNYTELPGVEMFADRLCRSLQLEMKGHLGDAHF